MHGKLPTGLKLSLLLLLISAFLAQPACASLDLVLVQPSNNQLFNATNNATFICNATSGSYLRSVSLYTNINGSLSQHSMKCFGEACNHEGDVLNFHFNNDSLYGENDTHVFDFSGKGNNASCSGSACPAWNSSGGKFFGSFEFDGDDDTLTVQDSDTLDLADSGTIEFWMKARSWNYQGQYPYFRIITKGTACWDNEAYGIWVQSADSVNGQLTLNLNNWIFDVSSLQSLSLNQWYHVAATWNGTDGRIYINGNLDSEEYGNAYTTSTTSDVFIGSRDPSCTSQNYRFNGTIDELVVYNRSLSQEEISERYSSNLSNHSSANWTIANISEGAYVWNCLAYDNYSQSNWSSQNSSFIVDVHTPPTVNSIILAPNSSDDVDPGTAINITANVSDLSGVGIVIFQWKRSGDWNNIIMYYNASSGLYENASFQTEIIEGVYEYRIWSNDSNGNSGFSATQNITSEWDYTWSRLPSSFGTASGIINTISNVGILAINNTADDTLQFSLSHNWPLAVYYNDSEESDFYVDNHTAITLNITARFASSDSENDMIITINTTHPTSTPSPSSLQSNATINSYTGGPYITVSILEYTAMVSQSQTFNLSARVKNIGNETGEGLWLNWTFSSGWSNSSGNTTHFIGNLTSESSFIGNLTVYLNPSSASPGTFFIYANSSCTQNASGFDSKTVGVNCSSSDGVCGYGCSYVTDSECSIPSSPGGGTGSQPVYVRGGGGETVYYSISIEVPQTIDIERDSNRTEKILIANTGEKTSIRDISLLIYGYPLTNLRISPTLIPKLEYNQTGIFDLELFVPNYMNYGVYNITLKAVGYAAAENSTTLLVEKTRTISLVIHSLQENETMRMLEEARMAVKEMSDSGLGTGKAKSLLTLAESQISQWDYDTSAETLKKLADLKEKALKASGLIIQLNEGISEAESYGFQTLESRKMRDLSISALHREDYAKAEERANNALVSFVIESRGLELFRFASSYRLEILVFSGITLSSAYAIRKKTLKSRFRKKIEGLSSEENAVKSLIEKAEEQRYKERTLPPMEFHEIMLSHQRRLAKIKREKSRLMAKLAGASKSNKDLEGLRKQEDYLKKEIAGIQKRYYQEGAISKSSYKKIVSELKEELALSIRNIELVLERRKDSGMPIESRFLAEKQATSQKKGLARLFLFSAFLTIAFVGAAFAQQNDMQAAFNAISKAEFLIKEMEQLGYPISYPNDTLNEARLLFSKGLYRGAESLARDVETIKQKAISFDQKSDEIESYLYQVSLYADVSEPKSLFEQGLAALKSEQYDRAEELFNQAQSKAEEMEEEAFVKKTTQGGLQFIISFLKDNFLMILLLVFSSLLAATLATRHARKRKLLKKIAGLKSEMEKASQIIKETQARYFAKGEITKSEYDFLMRKFRKRQAAIKRKQASLEDSLKKKEKPSKTA